MGMAFGDGESGQNADGAVCIVHRGGLSLLYQGLFCVIFHGR